mmetsp:Transcript_6087/g.11679  ORF Transcript_6087/g.11679 Transcript_6087/m.11679 type:complete len:221 (+) Transcript_6087:363-1025(+)
MSPGSPGPIAALLSQPQYTAHSPLWTLTYPSGTWRRRRWSIIWVWDSLRGWWPPKDSLEGWSGWNRNGQFRFMSTPLGSLRKHVWPASQLMRPARLATGTTRTIRRCRIRSRAARICLRRFSLSSLPCLPSASSMTSASDPNWRRNAERPSGQLSMVSSAWRLTRTRESHRPNSVVMTSRACSPKTRTTDRGGRGGVGVEEEEKEEEENDGVDEKLCLAK